MSLRLNNYCLYVLLGLFFILTFYFSFHVSQSIFKKYSIQNIHQSHFNKDVLNVWIIFTNAARDGRLVTKFTKLVKSIFSYGSNAPLQLHLIADKSSKVIAEVVLNSINGSSNYSIKFASYDFYDFHESIEKIRDIADVMTPHFSGSPGSYYSYSFFYLSLGLHRIAPTNQKYAVLLDCDMIFKTSINDLFQEFAKFLSTNLYGLAYEQSTVYHHGLRNYRKKHNDSMLGMPRESNNLVNKNDTFQFKGFPGFNSGVVLFNFEEIRQSLLLSWLLTKNIVNSLTDKYLFRGNLGDQDFFTLIGFDYPELFHTLDCGWNRQLCKWWQIQGNEKLFNMFFDCKSPVNIYHGNCNSQIPS